MWTTLSNPLQRHNSPHFSNVRLQCTCGYAVEVPWRLYFCLPSEGSAQETSARVRTHLMNIRGELAVHQASVSLWRSPDKDQRCLCNLGPRLGSLLAGDRQGQSTEAGIVMENLITPNPPLVKEACCRMQGCYNKASNSPPPPYRIKLVHITAEWVDHYLLMPPLDTAPQFRCTPLLLMDPPHRWTIFNGQWVASDAIDQWGASGKRTENFQSWMAAVIHK